MDYEFMKKVSEDLQVQKEMEKAEARRKAIEDQARTQLAYALIYMSIMFIGCIGIIAIINTVFQR